MVCICHLLSIMYGIDRNIKGDDVRYFQTWHWFAQFKYSGKYRDFGVPPKLGKFAFIEVWAQKICGNICGHEASETEKDYPGNGMVGQWCRWCNYFWEVPIEETPSAEYLRTIYNTRWNDGDDQILPGRGYYER